MNATGVIHLNPQVYAQVFPNYMGVTHGVIHWRLTGNLGQNWKCPDRRQPIWASQSTPHSRRIDMTNDTRDDTAEQARPARLEPMPATWDDMLALGLDPHTGEPLDAEEVPDGA